MSRENPSITFLIASIGRPILTNIIRSLYGQFNWGMDIIRVYFDGRCEAGLDYFRNELSLFNDRVSGSLELILLSENLGWWGHGIRNRYQNECTTDYIHHADDDDQYAEGCMFQVRTDLKENFGKVIIYKIAADAGVVPNANDILPCSIATPCGMIPNRPEIFGHWGEWYGGDYNFYIELRNKIGPSNIVYKPTKIYITKPHVKGVR